MKKVIVSTSLALSLLVSFVAHADTINPRMEPYNKEMGQDANKQSMYYDLEKAKESYSKN